MSFILQDLVDCSVDLVSGKFVLAQRLQELLFVNVIPIVANYIDYFLVLRLQYPWTKLLENTETNPEDSDFLMI
jgi:hypothetical protein